MCPPLSSVVLTAVLALAAAVPAGAQSSREDAIAREQAEKAGKLHPPVTPFIERKFLELEEAGGFGVSRGLFVALGGIKSGSGIAMGPVYGKTFAGGALFQARGGYSVRNFKLGELALHSAPLLDGRVRFHTRVRWQDAPELAVYPLGTQDSKLRADYAETLTLFGGGADVNPVRYLFIDAGASYERYDTGPAITSRSSVEELYTPADLPGLGQDPDYVHSSAGVFVDTGQGPGYTRLGTVLGARFHDYRQRDDGAFSFQRTDMIARQQIPILHGNWVLDFSARASTTRADDGDQVPFFLMPTLGGGRNLRGYSSYRFRDRHTIVLTAEYRWYAQEWVDMAVFYDAGKATARREDLDLDGLKSNVGIGVRFHSPGMTVLRIEVARGDEGLRLIFSGGAAIGR